MKITINITDELLEKVNGDLTITLNYKKSEELVESPKPNLVKQVTSKVQSFLSGDNSNSKSGMTFTELNNL